MAEESTQQTYTNSYINSLNYWPDYGKITQRTEESYEMDTGSLAVKVLNAFGLSHGLDGEDSLGTSLGGVDLKRVDPLAAINMSLLEDFGGKEGSTYPIEVTVNSYGNVEFIQVGMELGNITDIYYKIPTETFLTIDSTVKITGKKSEPIRKVGNWYNLLDESNEETVSYNTTQMATSCIHGARSLHATKTFLDPHLDKTANNDGISSIYEASSVWEKVIGWNYFLDSKEKPADLYTRGASIKATTESSVPILISSATVGDTDTIVDGRANKDQNAPDIGELIKRPFNPLVEEDPQCFGGMAEEASCESTAVKLENIPKRLRYENTRGTVVDNFKKISKVYVIGQELDVCRSIPKNEAYKEGEETKEENWQVVIALNDIDPKVIVLDEGIDYVVSYDGSKYTAGDSEAAAEAPCIQFINNTHVKDYAKWTEIECYVLRACSFSEKGTVKTVKATILPRSNDTGIMVQQIWAQVELNVPSVVVQDQKGEAASILDSVVFEICPISMIDEPAPLAIDGEIINLEDTVVDQDPTTTQPIQKTELELALDAMDGKQVVELNMSTLSEEQVKEFSGRLNDLMAQDRELDANINYVCGPTCQPVLGGTGQEGGVINSITYSYSDMGSYTISISEGPKILNNMSGVSGSVYTKRDEQVQAEGRISGSVGNGILFNVNVDGIGIIEATSGVPEILKVGDKVKVTIYNNPVES